MPEIIVVKSFLDVRLEYKASALCDVRLEYKALALCVV